MTKAPAASTSRTSTSTAFRRVSSGRTSSARTPVSYVCQHQSPGEPTSMFTQVGELVRVRGGRPVPPGRSPPGRGDDQAEDADDELVPAGSAQPTVEVGDQDGDHDGDRAQEREQREV